jgi:hypothetical protein
MRLRKLAPAVKTAQNREQNTYTSIIEDIKIYVSYSLSECIELQIRYLPKSIVNEKVDINIIK